MLGRGRHLPLAALLLATGCSNGADDLTIRKVGPAPALAAPIESRIAEARGQLALGNVGLAIEGFRRAQREDPASADALLGLAMSYDEMQRFELSRRYYEQSLALKPGNAEILSAFAASLARQGRTDEANSVRRELAERLAPAREAEVAVAAAPTVGEAAQVALVEQAPTTSITVKLPEARPAMPRPPSRHEAARASGSPRLERLSLTEVAIVTSGPMRWKSEVVEQTASSTTVRFVPLETKPKVRLLNAARSAGLAARTARALSRKGWPQVVVGDSERVREKSLVLYSAETEAAARKLAEQFQFAIAAEARPGLLTVLLGRDAAPGA